MNRELQINHIVQSVNNNYLTTRDLQEKLRNIEHNYFLCYNDMDARIRQLEERLAKVPQSENQTKKNIHSQPLSH